MRIWRREWRNRKFWWIRCVIHCLDAIKFVFLTVLPSRCQLEDSTMPLMLWGCNNCLLTQNWYVTNWRRTIQRRFINSSTDYSNRIIQKWQSKYNNINFNVLIYYFLLTINLGTVLEYLSWSRSESHLKTSYLHIWDDVPSLL